MLRQRDHVGNDAAEVRLQIVDLGRIGAQAREKARAGWRADGLLAVGAVELHAASGEFVEIRTLDVAGAVAAQLRPQIVDGDEQDVELLLLRCRQHSAAAREHHSHAPQPGAAIHEQLLPMAKFERESRSCESIPRMESKQCPLSPPRFSGQPLPALRVRAGVKRCITFA